MKRLLIALLLIATAGSTYAQNVDLRRKINVAASAEEEYTPDVININISLKEYKKNNREKADITTLENQLFSAVIAAGLPKSALTVNNVSSWNYNYNERKNPDFLISKQYTLKVPDQNSYNKIIKSIDPKGLNSTYINGTDYSKMEDLKMKLKINALRQAKAKAEIIAKTLGMTLGKPIEITDSDSSPITPVYARSYAMKAMAAGVNAEADAELDFKTQKASSNVNVVFEMM